VDENSSRPISVGGLTLVVPSHNEGSSLGRVLRDWWDHRPGGIPYEILVVDDASVDETPGILHQLESQIPVHSIRNATSLGFGGALREGILHTTTEWVAFTDADGQYDPADLPRLLSALSDSDRLVIGLRSPRADPFHRLAISIGFRGLLYAFFALRSKDPTSSLKVGRTENFRAVAESVRYMNGSFWNEFMIRWIRAGFTFVEVPVRHLPRRDGLSKVAPRTLLLRVSVQQLIALLRVWREFHRRKRAEALMQTSAPKGLPARPSNPASGRVGSRGPTATGAASTRSASPPTSPR